MRGGAAKVMAHACAPGAAADLHLLRAGKDGDILATGDEGRFVMKARIGPAGLLSGR